MKKTLLSLLLCALLLFATGAWAEGEEQESSAETAQEESTQESESSEGSEGGESESGEAEGEEGQGESGEGESGEGEGEGESGEGEGEGGQGQGMPSGGGGHRGGGGGRRGGGGGSMGGGSDNSETGGVTPGTALLDKHASGSKDTTLYDAAQTGTDATEATELLLRQDLPAITLTGEASFSVQWTEDTLCLTALTEGESWQIPLEGLEALKTAGIESICLVSGEAQQILSTDFAPLGSIWGQLRAKGMVAADFTLLVSKGGDWSLKTGDESWKLNATGELLQGEVSP